MQASIFDFFEWLLTDPTSRFGGNLLGQYIYSNSPNTPVNAITMGRADQDIKQVYGLECITPKVGVGQTYGLGSFIEQNKLWNVLLVQRAPPEPENPELDPLANEPRIFDAMERIEVALCYSFPGGASIQFSDANDVIQSYPQARISFNSTVYKNILQLRQNLIRG